MNSFVKKDIIILIQQRLQKQHGVSTGIVYNYFKDKHDILIEGIKIYADNIFYPMITISEENFDKNNFDKILRNMITKFIENHKLSQSAHEEITAMTHSDKEIANFFHSHEMKMTNTIVNLLIQNGFTSTNLPEKVHISIRIN